MVAPLTVRSHLPVGSYLAVFHSAIVGIVVVVVVVVMRLRRTLWPWRSGLFMGTRGPDAAGDATGCCVCVLLDGDRSRHIGAKGGYN